MLGLHRLSNLVIWLQVACSTAANAKALLKSAIRSDNPIIFFEHVLLYNVKGADFFLQCLLLTTWFNCTICTCHSER